MGCFNGPVELLTVSCAVTASLQIKSAARRGNDRPCLGRIFAVLWKLQQDFGRSGRYVANVTFGSSTKTRVVARSAAMQSTSNP
jgi:hypothetical protein